MKKLKDRERQQDIISLRLRIEVWDRNKKVLVDREQAGRSPVRAFLEAILAAFNQASVASVDVANTAQSFGVTNTSLLYAPGGAADDNDGIVIGTGSTAVDITDYALGTQIADGSGASQMDHEAQTYDADLTVSSPNADFALRRSFNNNSGGSITVKEIGMYCRQGSAGGKFFCIVRDVITQVIVPDGGGIRVTYTLRISE